MTRVWAYPWALGEDTEATLTALADDGVDGVSVASHYHSIRTLTPQADADRFVANPGGCYFDPGERFDGLKIDPPVNEVAGRRESLGHIADAADAAGLSLTAWTVCLHNSRLGSENPAYQVESAFGHEHDHALCPSNPEVRRYFAAVAGAAADRGADRIGLESIGYPSAFHGHGTIFGHDKNQALASPAEELLYSQCFCDACRERAGFDIDAAASLVREYCEAALATPEDTVPSLAALTDEESLLAELFAFRADTIESLVAEMADAAGDAGLVYYASAGLGRDPEDGWPAGVRLERLTDHLDRVVSLCYTDDPAVARERVAAFRDALEDTGVAVDAALSLDPEFVPNRDVWHAIYDAATAELSGELLVYNHSLLTDEHREWLADAA